VPSYEHKAFIPYTGVFTASPDASRHAVIQAKAVSLQPKQIILDREWQGSKELAFDYVVIATGTRLAAPGSMPQDDKASSVNYLQDYQQSIKKAKSILVVGGGAVGVQMACDLKEVYPEKDITLAHSREKLMPLYHEALSNIIKDRFKELGVKYVL
jgi:pyruvate/2-oxoglutarate dehydrogenase complex dihydrolipoamide dehydrogenase (E3) component